MKKKATSKGAAIHPEGAASRHEFLYHAYYCEENVWHLSQRGAGLPGPRQVVFISNPLGACPMWSQRAGRGRPVVWDYHVVLLSHAPFAIWDLDTTLGMPVPAADYLRGSFREGLPEPYLPLFRLVDASVFAEAFASDRAHMRGPDGNFLKLPPPWPPIGAAAAASNLMRFVDMESPFLGEVLSLHQLRARVE